MDGWLLRHNIYTAVNSVRVVVCLSVAVAARRRAGPQGDRALLAPEERRDMNDYETKMQTAERVGRKARHQKTRSAANK